MSGNDGARTVVVVVVAASPDGVGGHGKGAGPDLDLVDALARLQMATRRLGWRMSLHQTCDELARLLDLVGLDVALGAPGLPLQARGEAEGREQFGIEEVVPPRDPAA